MRALRLQGRELLVAAEPKSGASHLLRAMALVRAISSPHLQIVLAASDEQKMRQEHLEGEGGLWGLLSEAAAAGAVRWQPGGLVRFANGSSIQVTTWDAANRRNPDVLLVDDGEELGFAAFQKLRERTLRGPAGDAFPRLALVAHRPDEGWIREHWTGGEGRVRADLRHQDLPASLRARLPAPAPPLLFGDFIQRVFPDFPWYKHTEVLVDHMQSVVDGRMGRLLVQAPPRYFKSLIISRLLPAYYLHVRPWEWVTAVSAEESLALVFSKDARLFYANGGGLFRADSKEAALWRTLRGGGMWARGIEQGALGFGFNLGIIDDPFKSWKDGQRPLAQQAAEDYFWKTFYNRRDIASPRPASIVVMHQRLSEGDLAGRLLKREKEGKHPSEGWYMLDLPAVRKRRETPFPRSVKVLPDWREEGEALCPELQSVEELRRLELNDKLNFAAIYQQDPLPDVGGNLFQRWWWPEMGDSRLVWEMWELGFNLNEILAELTRRELLPVLMREGRAWDFAATEAAGDFTASVRGGITKDKQILYTDAFDRQIDAAFVKDLIVETALRDGRGVEVILPQEPAAAGKILISDLQQTLESKGFRVVVVPTTGSKWVRAIPHAGAAKADKDGNLGRCHVLPGKWNDRWAEQHHRFDGVTKPMDLVDATSELFSELEISSFLTGAVR